jgi:biopolymer transport protein ExbB/TolQ
MRYVLVVSVVLFTALGCNGKMIQKLESENQSLKSSADSLQQQARLLAQMTAENQTLKNRVDSLEHVAMALRDAPENRYREAMDLLAADRYDEAKTELESLALKYPASPLTVNAREQLAQLAKTLARMESERRVEERRLQAEARRLQQEEEAKYHPLSREAAVAQWREFRNHPELTGTVTTWRFKVHFVDDDLTGYVSGFDYPVSVGGSENTFTYAHAVSHDGFPKVREADWIVVTGKFRRVTESGYVVLQPIKVKNEGFRE